MFALVDKIYSSRPPINITDWWYCANYCGLFVMSLLWDNSVYCRWIVIFSKTLNHRIGRDNRVSGQFSVTPLSYRFSVRLILMVDVNVYLSLSRAVLSLESKPDKFVRDLLESYILRSERIVRKFFPTPTFKFYLKLTFGFPKARFAPQNHSDQRLGTLSPFSW